MATAARKTNWFAIWVSVAVVVVLLVVGGLVVWMNSQAAAPGDVPKASNINTDTGAISFGDGTDTMDTYIDFMCPICNQFEQTYGPEITALKDAGTITLNVHPIAILDSQSQGTQFSSRAASAMYAVSIASPDKALAFMQAMYANQPEEGSTGLTDDQIISIAEGAGVDMTADLKKAITSGKYIDYVQTMTGKTPSQPGSEGIGTPTVAINGTVIANSQLPSNPADLPELFKK
jgi:protein-disulfide isomerase